MSCDGLFKAVKKIVCYSSVSDWKNLKAVHCDIIKISGPKSVNSSVAVH